MSALASLPGRFFATVSALVLSLVMFTGTVEVPTSQLSPTVYAGELA